MVEVTGLEPIDYCYKSLKNWHLLLVVLHFVLHNA